MEKQEKIKKLRLATIIAGAFIAIVCLLMLVTYLQLKSTDPIESKSLEVLVERLASEPNNAELIDEIRKLDLLARKAYFSSIWQLRIGAYLLLFGAVVFVIILRYYLNLKFSIEKPSEEKVKDSKSRFLTQRWVAAAGIVVLVLAFISAFFTADYLGKYKTEQLVVADEKYDDIIEQIEVTERIVSDEPEDETVTDTVPQEEELAEEKKEARVETLLTAEKVQQNHNAFRGPWGQGISRRSNLPVQWDGDSGKNILWKTEIPVHGYNSPVVWDDLVFLTGANESVRVVYCLNRHTGEIIWEREADNIPGSPATPPETTDDTGLAAPSVTVDGQRVFAIFGTGDIIAFDFEGNRLWARNLGVPDNHYGHSSSLLTWDGKVFVQYDTQSGSRLLALSTSSGQTVWETPRTSEISWASPMLINVDGKFQLVLVSYPDVSGYEVNDGRMLWSVDCMSGEIGPSPAYGGGLVYAANEYATMVAINPKTGETVWQDRYYLPEVASPVYHDGLLYIATTYAVVAAFEAKTGELVWEYDAEDIFYSSPVIADNKLYVFDTSGTAYIFEPGDEPNLIATNELGDFVFATPAFAGNKIYVRSDDYLYCIGENR